MIETTVDSLRGIVFHECSGRVTWEEMLQAMAEAMQEQAFKNCGGTLWSFESGDFGFSLDEVADDIEAVRVHTNATAPNRKLAWVLNNLFSKILIDGYYTQMKWESEWRVFSKRRPALVWLGAHPGRAREAVSVVTELDSDA